MTFSEEERACCFKSIAQLRHCCHAAVSAMCLFLVVLWNGPLSVIMELSDETRLNCFSMKPRLLFSNSVRSSNF